MFHENISNISEELDGRSIAEIKLYFNQGISWSRILGSYTKDLMIDISAKKYFTINDMLTCPFCSKFLEQPVTLQCGCTCCKNCTTEIRLTQKANRECMICSKTLPEGALIAKTNSRLCSILKKFFENEAKGIELRIKADETCGNMDDQEVLKMYQRVIELCPNDHQAWRKKAQILFKMGAFEEALTSVVESCRIKPICEKAVFLKGEILFKLQRLSEAAIAFLCCIMINRERNEHIKMLNEVILSILEQNASYDENSYSDSSLVDPRDLKDAEHLASPEKRKLNTLMDIFRAFDQEAKYFHSSAPLMREMLTADKLEELACDTECNLCSRLIFKPITTVCGHLFCKDCLKRWLDHDHRCPLCRFSLFEYISHWEFGVTSLVESITQVFFPYELKEIADNHVKEMQKLASVATDTDEYVPIFVCSNSLPTRPLQLQIFEPRYRLMLRQCLESGSRQFGMCAYDLTNGYAEYGNMVEVNNVCLVPDGRAFLECTGGRRFKVISRDVKDGYNRAKVKWLKDKEISDENLDVIKKLNADVYAEMKSFVLSFLNRQDAFLSSCIPASDSENLRSRNGPSWIWWLIDLFVASEQLQLTFLSTESVEHRLTLIRKELLGRKV